MNELDGIENAVDLCPDCKDSSAVEWTSVATRVLKIRGRSICGKNTYVCSRSSLHLYSIPWLLDQGLDVVVAWSVRE